MAIRNINIGGASNWDDTGSLTSTDLNDTFNAALAQPPFWMNGSLYTEYDNFSTGSPIDSTKWVITGGWTVSAGSLSGAVNGSEALGTVVDGTISLVTSGTTLPTGRNAYHLKGYLAMVKSNDPNPTETIISLLTNNGSTYQIFQVDTTDPYQGTLFFDAHAIKVSGNNYDFYTGGRRIGVGIDTLGALQLGFKGVQEDSNPQQRINLYLSDLVYTKS